MRRYNHHKYKEKLKGLFVHMEKMKDYVLFCCR